MTQVKRWPIGLQSGNGGDPRGIGEVIQTLTANHIAFFSASVKAFSILTDLQNARAAHPEVPHTANFAFEGYVDGYHVQVPEYGKPHSVELAVRHWNKVEQLEPINDPARSPIDWENPCIWVSTWNEVRPYVGWSQRGEATPEDPVDGYEGNADLIGWQAVEIGKEAVRRGYRWTAFGFAGGNPEEGFWDAPGVLAYLRLCAQYPEQLGVALHEYSHAMTILDRPDKIGRFKQLHAACDRHGIRRPVIHIKEFGWRDVAIPDDPQEAMRQLKIVADMYMAHPNIHGAALWTVLKWQGSDIWEKVRALIPALETAALRHAKEIGALPLPPAPEQPAPPPHPPAPGARWPYAILSASAAEARARRTATAAEFGIDVSRWQGDRLNWRQLKEDGVRFAYLRVGSGKTIRDANYDRNVYGCLRSGIPFGNYYYLYEDVDAKQQARLFVHQADWRSTLPPAVDIEQLNLTAEQIKTFIDEFHRLVDAPPIMIYTRATIWNRIVSPQAAWPSRHPLWVAHWEANPPSLPHNWDRWLFFQAGHKRGLRGYPRSMPTQPDTLDYNHFNGSLAELSTASAPVRVRAVAYADYLPFDAPVGSAAQRARREPMYPGDWYDANPFGTQYTNPTTGRQALHTGSDLNLNQDADKGKPVYAAADGVITFAGQLDVWGGVVVIKHGPSLFSRYGHVTDVGVAQGQAVVRGQQIARVGQDAGGGPFHLHFDISHSDVLETKPWHWPGMNREMLVQNYVNPKAYIERHRPFGTTPAGAPRLPVPDRVGYVTATRGLNLRSEPSTVRGQATVLDALPHGARVGIYSEANGWYRVRVGNRQGFVLAKHIGDAPQTAVSEAGGGGAYRYRGPAVRFFTGIHGPADDWMWQNGGLRDMVRRLDMPIFYWSHGANREQAGLGDVTRNAVRLYWSAHPVSAEEAYREIRDDQLIHWWRLGYRRFVFFNEPQLTEEVAGFPEGMGIAWHSADEFARYLAAILKRARAEFSGIQLFTTPMTSNPAYQPWVWRETMWARVQGLVNGWCMHAYSGDNERAEHAAENIAQQVRELQQCFRLQIPILVSEASVNRGSNVEQKARVAHLVHAKLARVPGVEGVFWFAADWAEGMDRHHEGWLRNGIGDAYLRLRDGG